MLDTVVYAEIPVHEILANPNQPRQIFDSQGLQELAESIKEHGVIQPINVRPLVEGGYELISGERRLRASKLAGVTTIPAIVKEVDELESSVIALIENLQRRDLSFFEEAEGIAKLIEDYRLKQEEVAASLGKRQSTIANKLRILRLSTGVKAAIKSHGLSERHARALLLIEGEDAEDKQLAVIEKIVAKGLTVKKTEELIERLNTPPKKKGKIHTYIKDLRIFTNTVTKAVQMMKDSGLEADYEVDEAADGCYISVIVKYGSGK